MLGFALEQLGGLPVRSSPRFHLHVVGATYAYEGRSDWGLLKMHIQRLDPSMSELAVLLNFGDPWQIDNSAAVKTPQTLRSIREPADRPLDSEAMWEESQACYDDVREGIFVSCNYGFYQDTVIGRPGIPKPDLVLLSHTGLGQWQRRTFDPVVRYLLESGVTAIMTAHASAPVLPAGSSVNPFIRSPRMSEMSSCAVTMDEYGARLVSSFVSPFPIVYQNSDERVLKGYGVLVYRGLREGISMCSPRPLPKEDAQYLRQLRNKFLGDSDGAACAAYDRAMRKIFLADTALRRISRKEPELAAVFSRMENDPEASFSVFDSNTMVRARDRHEDEINALETQEDAR